MLKKSLLSIAVTFALTACGGSSSNSTPTQTPAPTPTPAPAPTPTNTAPTAIALSSMEVAENAMGGVVGDLTVTDADSGDTHTFTVSDERFEIAGTQLKLKDDAVLDYEKEQSVTVTLTTVDSAGNSYAQEFTLTVGDELDFYAFTSSVNDKSSVSYSGQIARHLLILELNNYISSGLDKDIQDNVVTSQAEAEAKLVSYFDGDWELQVADRVLTTSTLVDKEQNTFGDISGSSKNLVGKVAGNDETGQHKLWKKVEDGGDGAFVAFGEKGSQSPEGLIRSLLAEIAANAFSGDIRLDPLGNEISKAYIATDGRDLKQLVQKSLLGMVAFSQGADDYLDNTVEGKGLLSDNTALDADKDSVAYTSLEHQFDEGFGYFGAARDYLSYSDLEIANKGGRDEFGGMHDTNGNGKIDFNSEYNFGHSQNAAKRDIKTATHANKTDFTADAMNAFLKGRQIIADANTAALTTEQMTALLEQRDIALLAWEKAISATVVHYINDTNKDYAKWGTSEFSFSDLAKHWSEMKGFLINLQFNPHSPLTDAQFEQVNTLIGDAPVTSSEADIDAYEAQLIQARDILEQAYSFDNENVVNW